MSLRYDFHEKRNIGGRCSPKYADLYKSAIDVKESEIERLIVIESFL
jgi:hypothetical protein